MENGDEKIMHQAIRLSKLGMHDNKGGPFGSIVVKDGVIIGRGQNQVTNTKDPTAHAEVVAIREACQHLGDFQLTGCEIYTSCEPCPMCLGAIYWARPDRVYYACNKEDAAEIGFDDDFIYKEIALPHHERKIPFKNLMREEALKVFKEWEIKEDKNLY